MTIAKLTEIISQRLGYTFCRVSLFDNARDLHVNAVHGAALAFLPWTRCLWGTPWGPAYLPRQTTLLSRKKDDVVLDELENYLNASDRSGVSRLKLASLLMVPIIANGSQLGVLDIGERRTRTTVEPRSIELAERFAEQLASGIQANALALACRCCELLGRDAMFAQVDLELRELLRSSPDSIYEVVTQSACNLLDCHTAALLTHQHGQKTLRIAVTCGQLPKNLVDKEIPIGPELEAIVGASGMPRTISAGEPFHGELFHGTKLEDRGALGVPFVHNGRADHVAVLAETGSRPFGALAEEMIARFALHVAQVFATPRDTDRRQVRPLEVLQRISDYIHTAADEEKILHAVLTGITAGYGLGFNRAALLLLNDATDSLEGRLGIGHVDRELQNIAWNNIRDHGNSTDGLEPYLHALEDGRVKPEPIHDRVLPLRLPITREGAHPDVFSLVLQESKCIHWNRAHPNGLPREFIERFEPHDEIAVAPLTARNRVIGLVACDYKFILRRIRSADLEALKLFATTAATALEHRRRLTKTQSMLADIAKATTTGDKATLESIVNGVHAILGCDTVTLYVYDEGKLKGAAHVVGCKDKKQATQLGEATESSLVRHLFDSGEPHYTKNAPEDKFFTTSRFTRDENILSVAAQPLPGRGGSAVGLLFVSYRRVHDFHPEERENIRLLANQAAIAIENAKLFKNQDCLLELSNKLLQSETVEKLLDSTVGFAKERLAADRACIALLNAKKQIIVSAAVGWEPFPVGTPLPPGRLSHAGFVIQERQTVSVHDYENEDRFKTPKEIREPHGSVSGLGVPLRVGNEVIGALLAHKDKPGYFDHPDIARFMELLANQAAIAINTAQVADNLAKQQGRQDALHMAMQAIQGGRRNRSDILKQVLENAVGKLVVRNTLVAPQGATCTLATLQKFEPSRNGLVCQHFFPEELAHAKEGVAFLPIDPPLTPKMGVTVRAFKLRTAQLVPDVARDPDYRELNEGITSELAVPVVDEGEVLGVLNVESSEPFNEDDKETMNDLAALAALIMRDDRDLRKLSHDFKDPITLIQHNVENLRLALGRVSSDDDYVREYLDNVYDAVRKLTRINADVMSFAGLQPPADLCECAPIEILGDVVKGLAWEAKQARVTLCEPEGWKGKVKLYKTQMEQAITNVMANAIKFNRSGGEVTSRVDPKGAGQEPEVVITIEDTGCGIAEEHRGRIFEPFFRVNADHLGDGAPGCGLGLHIVKESIELHGGHVAVTSTVDRGSTFTITLPLQARM